MPFRHDDSPAVAFSLRPDYINTDTAARAFAAPRRGASGGSSFSTNSHARPPRPVEWPAECACRRYFRAPARKSTGQPAGTPGGRELTLAEQGGRAERPEASRVASKQGTQEIIAPPIDPTENTLGMSYHALKGVAIGTGSRSVLSNG